MLADAQFVIGLPWGEAEPRLRADGLAVQLLVTRPPNSRTDTGELRVVGVRPRGDGLQVILAYHRETGGRAGAE